MRKTEPNSSSVSSALDYQDHFIVFDATNNQLITSAFFWSALRP